MQRCFELAIKSKHFKYIRLEKFCNCSLYPFYLPPCIPAATLWRQTTAAIKIEPNTFHLTKTLLRLLFWAYSHLGGDNPLKLKICIFLFILNFRDCSKFFKDKMLYFNVNFYSPVNSLLAPNASKLEPSWGTR